MNVNRILVIFLIGLVQWDICLGCSVVPGYNIKNYGPVETLKKAQNVVLAKFIFNSSNMDLNIGEFEVQCVFKSSIAVQEFRNTPIGISEAVMMNTCQGSMQMQENSTYLIALDATNCPEASHIKHCFGIAEPDIHQHAVFLPTAANLQMAADICGFPNVTTVPVNATCPMRNVTTETCIFTDNGAGNVDTLATLILAMISISLGMV
ncbi:unnamed protein product [Owenia fusiformis]|uniref:Secreted protein n=1 Tax=Owenia fusiformis TaxID=6347 RepID=A0A8S4PDP1_OWEFU|nr:unnamed protein product [Owenia fusiformis]